MAAPLEAEESFVGEEELQEADHQKISTNREHQNGPKTTLLFLSALLLTHIGRDRGSSERDVGLVESLFLHGFSRGLDVFWDPCSFGRIGGRIEGGEALLDRIVHLRFSATIGAYHGLNGNPSVAVRAHLLTIFRPHVRLLDRPHVGTGRAKFPEIFYLFSNSQVEGKPPMD